MYAVGRIPIEDDSLKKLILVNSSHVEQIKANSKYNRHSSKFMKLEEVVNLKNMSIESHSNTYIYYNYQIGGKQHNKLRQIEVGKTALAKKMLATEELEIQSE